MKQTVEVTSCYHACPFFGLDGGPGAVMVCEHPAFDNALYDGYIINQNNCHDRVPDECPLRKGPVIKEISLKGTQNE